MDRARSRDNGNSDFSYRHSLDQRSRTGRCDMENVSTGISSSSSFSGPSLFSSPSPSIPPLPPSCSFSDGTVTVVVGGVRYIVHRVTKMDTLAGVAIKYGVEVADIKRINGLVTDRQMFAHKSLHIPLPGRHLPSPNPSNGYNTNGLNNAYTRRRSSDLFESFQTLKLSYSSNRTISPAMNSLQDYYGLKPTDNESETPVYIKGSSSSNPYNPPLNLDRKSKSLANGLNENGETTKEEDSNKLGEKLLLLRRRQKSEADFAKAGKGLALRSKPGNRNGSGVDIDMGNWLNHVHTGLSESFVNISDGLSLQDQESFGSSSSSLSIWSKPIFDGLSNPITGRKNKAALD